MNTLISFRRYLVLFILMSGLIAIHGQTLQQLSRKLTLYGEKYPEESVFLHTDKNTFAPGDILWFSAYITQELGNRTTTPSRDLFVSLIAMDSLEVIHTFFPINNNKSIGSIDIPDQLASGHYLLIAYTSWMKNMPVDRMFSKEIIIEKENRKALVIHIRLDDTICPRNVAVPAYITIANREKMPVGPSDWVLTEREFQNPEVPGSGSHGKQKSTLPKTFFWKPEFHTDAAGKATISYFNGEIPGDVVVTVEGISDSGQPVSGSVVYSVEK